MNTIEDMMKGINFILKHKNGKETMNIEEVLDELENIYKNKEHSKEGYIIEDIEGLKYKPLVIEFKLDEKDIDRFKVQNKYIDIKDKEERKRKRIEDVIDKIDDEVKDIIDNLFTYKKGSDRELYEIMKKLQNDDIRYNKRYRMAKIVQMRDLEGYEEEKKYYTFKLIYPSIVIDEEYVDKIIKLITIRIKDREEFYKIIHDKEDEEKTIDNGIKGGIMVLNDYEETYNDGYCIMNEYSGIKSEFKTTRWTEGYDRETMRKNLLISSIQWARYNVYKGYTYEADKDFMKHYNNIIKNNSINDDTREDTYEYETRIVDTNTIEIDIPKWGNKKEKIKRDIKEMIDKQEYEEIIRYFMKDYEIKLTGMYNDDIYKIVINENNEIDIKRIYEESIEDENKIPKALLKIEDEDENEDEDETQEGNNVIHISYVYFNKKEIDYIRYNLINKKYEKIIERYCGYLISINKRYKKIYSIHLIDDKITIEELHPYKKGLYYLAVKIIDSEEYEDYYRYDDRYDDDDDSEEDEDEDEDEDEE